MTRDDVLEQLRSNLDQIRRRFVVKRLALFGSTARGTGGADSDVDVLVEFEGPARFDAFMDLKFFLEDLLCARVDLVTHQALRPAMRETIEQEALYVA